MTDQVSLQLALGREDTGLQVGAFVQILNETTNSYKYLFLLGLLDHISSKPPDQPIKIPLSQMAIDMAILAWFPCRYFKLSFGVQDQLPRLLLSVGAAIATRKHGREVLQHIRNEIPKHVELNDFAKTLLRYVPFRLLKPFYVDQLTNTKDSEVDGLIRVWSQKHQNSDSPPLYTLHGLSNRPQDLTLEIHPRWQTLLLRWHAVIRAWVLHEWAKYLQARNPSMPNILGKLLPPDERSSTQFNKSRTLWRQLLSRQRVTCPYTGNELKAQVFGLDHFLPWSYVGHDLPWNLVATLPSVNSSKGAKLPDEKYIEAIAIRQHQALRYARKNFTPSGWSNWTESYCQDLRISDDELLNRDALVRAYKQTMVPQIVLGRQLGFEGGWE